MKDLDQLQESPPPAKKRPVLSLRLIASLAVASLVAGAVLTISHRNENYIRRALEEEAEVRLLLEARYLALLTSKALLSPFPELMLVPIIKDLQKARPEVPLMVVLDSQGLVLGDSDPRTLGHNFIPPIGLKVRTASASLHLGEEISENQELIVVNVPVAYADQDGLGKAIIGMDKAHLENHVRIMRADLYRYSAFLLVGAMVLAALLMTVMLRPIKALRAGLEEIGRGNLDSPMKITDPTELGLLAKNVNAMAAQLKASNALAQEREKEVLETQKEIIHTLGDVVESRSAETANHTLRVGDMSYRLAVFSGLDKDEAELLRMAAPMHDIGKIGIPDSILNKPGKLTTEEYEIIKTHAAIGYGILSKSDRLILKAAAIVAHEHHERWDGTGYPRGMRGEGIHIFGRIVSLVDVFDALYSDRVYRPAMPLDKVLGIITDGRGSQFEPRLVDIFLDNFPEFLNVLQKYQDVTSSPGMRKMVKLIDPESEVEEAKPEPVLS